MAEEAAPRQGRPDLLAIPDAEALAAATALVRESQTLVLASADEHGEPLASYAPYVAAGGALHVFVSRLAAHSANLAREKTVSVMLIEDQVKARQPFARVRLVSACGVTLLSAQEPGTASVLDALGVRFGAVVDTLRALPDFRLYRLTPRSAQFVQGFGQAFALRHEHLQRVLADAAHAG